MISDESIFIMCLTIPKKVIEKRKSGCYILEKNNGEKQEVKSIIKIKLGDFVLTQSNVIIEKISKKQAQEINSLLNK